MSSLGITSVPGIKVGHYTDTLNATGCTVVLCEEGAVGGVDVRGSAPWHSRNRFSRPHRPRGAGSCRRSERRQRIRTQFRRRSHELPRRERRGLRVRERYSSDSFGSDSVRPWSGKRRGTTRAGRWPCRVPSPHLPNSMEEGSVGAGTGATVAKLLGRDRCVKGGIGTSALGSGRRTSWLARLSL